MAVVTVKSAAITNRDATPRVLNNSRVANAELMWTGGLVAIANGDSATSKYIICSLPSNAMLKSVRYSAPDIGTTTAFDLGFYRTTEDGGAVVDADAIASAVALNAGPYNQVEIINEAGAVLTVADREKPLWQILGLTADPKVQYDMVATLTGAADAAGSVMFDAEYTQ